MKKVLTILLSVFLIIGLCGCGKKTNEQEEAKPTNPYEITLGDTTYVLDKEETFGNISYRIDANMVKRTYTYGTPSVNYTAVDPQGTGAFAIRIFEYQIISEIVNLNFIQHQNQNRYQGMVLLLT